MSENHENQNITQNAEVVKSSEESVVESENKQEQNIVSDLKSNEGSQIKESENNTLQKIFQMISDKNKELQDITKQKEEYLVNNLANFNTENYLQNAEFKELYSEAFNALGTNLDTQKFVNLLDKYVESRIKSYNRQNLAKQENESLTDSMEFSSGKSKKSEKNLRMQDIPPEELEKYIAKYL